MPRPQNSRRPSSKPLSPRRILTNSATRRYRAFLLKVTPTGRKSFRVAYVANNGQRRKPAIGRFGEITVE